jgi:hypothetical protein
MGPLSAAQLIALWDRSQAGSPHRQLEPLLAAVEPEARLDADTLGARNRRLLAFHRLLSGGPLDARLRCAGCGTDNAFAVPADAILACPAADPEARILIRSGRHRLSFRLPRMADISAAAGMAADDVLPHIVSLCLVAGTPGRDVPRESLDRLAERFEALDPAARIIVACAECGKGLRASVNVAEFVANAVERIVARLYREIHAIARAYGWSEDEILSLPASRRRAYVAMIADQREAAQPARLRSARRA